jgi:hypothetical protein
LHQVITGDFLFTLSTWMIWWKNPNAPHISMQQRELPGLTEAVWLHTGQRAWSLGPCSSLGSANGLGAAESSLVTRPPLTSIERMSVTSCQDRRDLCSLQAQKMYLGRGAVEVAWPQSHISARKLLKTFPRWPRTELLLWSAHQV